MIPIVVGAGEEERLVFIEIISRAKGHRSHSVSLRYFRKTVAGDAPLIQVSNNLGSLRVDIQLVMVIRLKPVPIGGIGPHEHTSLSLSAERMLRALADVSGLHFIDITLLYGSAFYWFFLTAQHDRCPPSLYFGVFV